MVEWRLLLTTDRRKGYRQKGRLNLFGQYFDEVCKRLDITWEQVAREAGVDPSTLHYICSAEKNHTPKRETIKKIVNALKQHDNWLDLYKVGMFNTATHATDEQIAEAEHHLAYMKYIDEHPLQPDTQ